MPVDPQVQAYLDHMVALNMPPRSSLTPEVVRQGMQMQIEALGDMGKEQVARVENRTIPGPAGEIPVRIYTPEGQAPFPVLVFFHGGGWVICNLDTHDAQCRSLAKRSGCVVVSVDYRLAPEHKFPAAPEDCYTATRWVAEHADEVNGDSAHLAIGGDSAGGNLTAVVAQMAHDRGYPHLVFQLMIYPLTDLQNETPSYRENGTDYGLTRDEILWFKNHYLNSRNDETNPLASPLLSEDLSGLPPALILTAEYDPLRDEGEAYGHRLQAAGVPVIIRRYAGQIHGFFGMGSIVDWADQAVSETAQTLREAL